MADFLEPLLVFWNKARTYRGFYTFGFIALTTALIWLLETLPAPAAGLPLCGRNTDLPVQRPGWP